MFVFLGTTKMKRLYPYLASLALLVATAAGAYVIKDTANPVDIYTGSNTTPTISGATSGAVTLGPSGAGNVFHTLNGRQLEIKATGFDPGIRLYKGNVSQIWLETTATDELNIYNGAGSSVYGRIASGAWTIGPSGFSGTHTIYGKTNIGGASIPGLMSHNGSDTLNFGLNYTNQNTSNYQIWSDYTSSPTVGEFNIRYRVPNDTGTPSVALKVKQDGVSELGLGLKFPLDGGAVQSTLGHYEEFSTTSCSVVRNTGTGTLTSNTCSEYCSRVGKLISCTLHINFTLSGAQTGTFNISGGYGSAFRPARDQEFQVGPTSDGGSRCFRISPSSAGDQVFVDYSCTTGAQQSPTAGTYDVVFNMMWQKF